MHSLSEGYYILKWLIERNAPKSLKFCTGLPMKTGELNFLFWALAGRAEAPFFNSTFHFWGLFD
jgi:hypothetical protein